MDKKIITESGTVSLIFAFKVALDRENYLLCRYIKDELIKRKQAGELTNELITAFELVYEPKDNHYKNNLILYYN